MNPNTPSSNTYIKIKKALKVASIILVLCLLSGLATSLAFKNTLAIPTSLGLGVISGSIIFCIYRFVYTPIKRRYTSSK